MAPSGEGTHPAESWAEKLEGLAGAHLERAVRALRDELDRVRRRPLAGVRGETVEALAELVLDRGAGFTALEVSVALRVTPTFVRRTRLAHGLDAERGRHVKVNGHGAALGVQLIANGYSVRAAAAAAISGVPRSTLHDGFRRASRPRAGTGFCCSPVTPP